MSMFDHHDPDYSVDRIYEAADRIKKERRENLAAPDVIASPEGTRYPCPEGCGSFDSMIARDIHVITEHDGTTA